ncbi:MAG TPA: IPT/TIG domain-containing protein [Kofleriaceae bacterium]
MSSRSPHWFPAGLILLLGLAAAACGSDSSKLTVTGIDPKQGDIAGDTYVRIFGTRFTTDPHTVKVYFGGHPAQIDRFVTDNELIVVAPGGKLNEVVDVLIVFEPGGKVNLPNAYRYIEKNKAAPSVDDLNISPDKPRK